MRRIGKKNNTTGQVYFISKLPLNKEGTLSENPKKRIRYYFKVMKKGKFNVAGSMILDYVCDQPGGTARGLGKFCLNMLNSSAVQITL